MAQGVTTMIWPQPNSGEAHAQDFAAVIAVIEGSGKGDAHAQRTADIESHAAVGYTLHSARSLQLSGAANLGWQRTSA